MSSNPRSLRKLGAHVGGGLDQALNNALLIDANCLQLFAGSPRMWKRSLWPITKAQTFSAQAVNHGLTPLYIHALYLTNLASDNPELVTKSTQALITDMTNSARINGSGVVLHIGSHQGRGWDQTKAQVISCIKEVLSQTPKNAYLLLENSAGQKGKIGKLTELNEIISQIDSPRLRVCLDTAHAFEAGYNLSTSEGLEIWLREIEQTITFSKIELLHLNDSKTPLGSGRDNHQNIGDGYIGLVGLKRLINHPKLAHLPLILEVPGIAGLGPDKENINRVKSLLE